MNEELIAKYKREYFATTGRLLSDDFYKTCNRKVKNIEYWEKVILEYFNITKEQLISKGRKYEDPRRWFYYICKKNGITEKSIYFTVNRERSGINKVFHHFFKKIEKSPVLQNVERDLLNY